MSFRMSCILDSKVFEASRQPALVSLSLALGLQLGALLKARPAAA